MPAPIDYPKTEFVNELWLPLVRKGGDQLFPRRANKKMKMLTLTDMKYQEVKVFESNKLLKREDIAAWNHSHQQAYRLETELGRSKILCEGRFEDAINDDRNEISAYLPCEILNMDFSSQKPIVSYVGRIEKEINGTDILIGLLDNIQSKGFILLYTTYLDQNDLSLDNLSFDMGPLSFINPARSSEEKTDFIKGSINDLLRIHNYDIQSTDDRLITLNDTDLIFSVGFVTQRNN